MRRDMKDVIIDTGRRGGHGKAALSRRARFKRLDADDMPSFIPNSRRRQYGWDSKELGDRINPLHSFLEANCGRLWDDVYSEICAAADMRTIRGYHLRQHVWNLVVPNNYDVGHHRRYGPFFVHSDGTLQLEATTPRRRRRYRNPDDNPRWVIDGDHFWEKIKGFWYYFETTRWIEPCSFQELVEEDGEVKIVTVKMRDRKCSKTLKRQVDGETQKELNELWANQIR